MAAELLGRGVREVVVKRGAAGAGVHTADGRWEAPAVAVTSIDTVGAGDAFTAGYLSALLDGGDVAGRLQRGTLRGPSPSAPPGTGKACPRRAELALLGDHAGRNHPALNAPRPTTRRSHPGPAIRPTRLTDQKAWTCCENHCR